MTGWTLYTLEWNLIQHPPYSSDMLPSDYYLFSHLHLQLDGTIFHSNDEVVNEVDRFLDRRTPQFFSEGIEKLTKGLQTIIDLNGDYYLH
ncbi:histone-lysine N-methyltransferase SETMAR [Trichonephila clavipes]|nr:histone-lysine N-methyltransferase SETMAR [Trichonephila clavipes]